jgi:hypothetical protein
MLFEVVARQVLAEFQTPLSIMHSMSAYCRACKAKNVCKRESVSVTHESIYQIAKIVT